MDAINPAHGSVLRVNSPSLGIFSLRSSSSPVHPASGGSEGGNGEPDEDGRGEDGKRSEMEHGEKRTERPIEPCPCHFASPIRASFLVTSFRLVVISSLPTVPSSFTPSRHFVPPPAARMDGVSERVNERQTDRREEERNTHALSLLSSRFPFSLPRLSLLTSSEPRERVTGTEPKRGDRHERGR